MERRDERWHVGKEVPLALLFAIFMQTLGAIWWAATVTTKLDELSYQVAALNADKYSQRDAARDQALTDEKFNNLKRRLEYMESVKWQKRP